MNKEILELFKNTKLSGISSKIKANKPYLDEIKNYNQDWETNSLSEMIYLYVYQKTPQICPCGNKTKFVSLAKGYNKFCKRNCEHAVKEQTKNRLQTQKQKGGIGLANSKTREKAKDTLKKKYDIENPGQSDNHKKMMTENNPMHDKKIIENMKQSCQETWGVDWHSKRPDVIQKTKKSLIDYYGVDNISKINYSPETVDILENKEKLSDLYIRMSIEDISEHLNISLTTVYNYLLKHNIREKKQVVAEQQIIQFLNSLGIENIQHQTRKIITPYELDVYLPNHNLAIEHCGLYWHSHKNGFTRYYHHNKLKSCEQKGIRLITIFEDEWQRKRTTCQNRIKHALGMNETGKGARKLLVRGINDKQTVFDFLDKHHIQGRANYDTALAAYDGDEIVALMTFSKPRHYMNQKTTELSRFCTNGKNYPGIGSKLFKYYIKTYDPDKITSMCDLRWGTGTFYQNLGLEFKGHTTPNYWYFGDKSDKLRRWYRYYFNKKALLKKYPEFDGNTMSEWDIMKSLGYDKIWDCGNLKYEWSKPS